MDFVIWLQTRLKELGYYKAEIDGDWGALSVAALKQFQIAYGLPATCVSDAATIAALKAAVAKGVPAAPAPAETMPPWMAEMHRRMGLHEVRDNKTLAEWLRFGRFLGNPAKLPWCGDAIETCIAKTLPSEPVPSNPFWAQAWNTFGVDVKDPIVGSIGVIRWDPSSGHVGIVAGFTGSTVHLLGGNQSNAITVATFARSDFIGWRWPRSYPVKAYPALKGSAVKISGAAATR
ncbi:NlpC/P60 family protein [Shinella pollutisoli]|uniref:Peptidoglycan-binding protein n=1 Tax=Shinella pollutisoli TaxID=2250594 RepID=A0ABV7DJX3_9HYPH|nr:peptidoglycan-binding protein [Shinella pollutisoli]